MPWLELSVQSRHPELAEEILFVQGAVAVTLSDAGDAPILEPGPGATPLWPTTETVGLFAADRDAAAVVAALRELLPDGAQAALATRRLDDEDWVAAGLRDLQPLKFGEHLYVCPRGRRVAEPGAVTVMLEPGLGFGTGTHPTTALCLEWLAGADLAGREVLDYGCGSGILALAALKLGARRATAVDIDPQALAATRANAVRNGIACGDVAGRMQIVAAETFTARPYDIVLANILAAPLIALVDFLSTCVKPGGSLVLSGLLERQADEVRRAYSRRFDLHGVEQCVGNVLWRAQRVRSAAEDAAHGGAAQHEGWIRLSGTRCA